MKMAEYVSRRTFLKLAGVGAVGTILAACGPAPATEAPKAEAPKAAEPTSTTAAAAPAASKKIVFSTYTWSNFEAAMTEILNGWKAKNPNFDYEAQFVPQTIDYWAKVQTQVASGTPPDAGISDYGRLVSYAKNGTLLDITDMVQASKFPIDKMFPGASAQYRWAKGDFDSGAVGGSYYGLPSDAQSQIFAYNKKMFDDAGVAYPTDDWTWDDMLAAAQKITKADQNIWGMQVIDNSILFKGNFVWSAGGALHSPDFQKSMLADPKTIEAYKWDWDLIYTHKVAPPPSAATGQQNPFMSGQVAMYVDGVWWVTDFAAGIKDFGWDVALFPKHPQTGKRTTTLESDGWWIYKGTKDPDTAWNLISYLADPGGQSLFSKAGFCIPSNIQDVAKDWYSQTPPEHRLKILDNINADSAKVDFTYFEFGTITNAVWPVITKAFADGTDITEAMQEADKVMNDELTKAWALLKQ
jgi:multiple sugar transport system substrate-binding protein